MTSPGGNGTDTYSGGNGTVTYPNGNEVGGNGTITNPPAGGTVVIPPPVLPTISNLVGYYRPETLTAGANNRWNDSSASNNNAVLINGQTAPQMTTVNNNSALIFPASIGSVLNAPMVVIPNQICTTFTVFAPTSFAAGNNSGNVSLPWYEGDDGINGFGPFGPISATQSEILYGGRLHDINNSGGAYTLGTTAIQSTKSTTSGGAPSYYVNGALFTAAANPGGIIAPTTGIYIGGGKPSNGRIFNGTISEIILYSRALTDVERYSVESYLSTKYNIPVTQS